MKKIVCSVFVVFLLLSCSSVPEKGTAFVIDPSVQWEASWIGIYSPEDVITGDVSLPARYLRTTFKSDKRIREAKLHICGLGLYEAYLNGVKVGGAQVLSPTVSNYDKTVYYHFFGIIRQFFSAFNFISYNSYRRKIF